MRVRGCDGGLHGIRWRRPVERDVARTVLTDFHAAQNGMISVTPLQVDLTRYSQLPTIAEWIDATQ